MIGKHWYRSYSQSMVAKAMTIGQPAFQKSFFISQDMLDALSGIFGDKNPIHLDRAFASSRGFERPIAHGAIINAIVSNVIGNDIPGHGSIILSSKVDYIKPLFVNDRVELSAYILHHSEAVSVYDIRIDVSVERPKQKQHKVAVVNVRVMCKS